MIRVEAGSAVAMRTEDQRSMAKKKNRASLLGDFRSHTIAMIHSNLRLWNRAAEFFNVLTSMPLWLDIYEGYSKSHRLGDVDMKRDHQILQTVGSVDSFYPRRTDRGDFFVRIMVWQFWRLMNTYLERLFGNEHIRSLTGNYQYFPHIKPYDKGRLTSYIDGSEVLFRVPRELEHCRIDGRIPDDPPIEFFPGKVYPARLIRSPFSSPSTSNTWRPGYPGNAVYFDANPPIADEDMYMYDDTVLWMESEVPNNRRGHSFPLDGIDGFADIMNRECDDRFCGKRVFLPVEWIVAFTPRTSFSKYDKVIVLDDAWWNDLFDHVGRLRDAPTV